MVVSITIYYYKDRSKVVDRGSRIIRGGLNSIDHHNPPMPKAAILVTPPPKVPIITRASS